MAHDQHAPAVRPVQPTPFFSQHLDAAAEQRARRGSAEGDEGLRADGVDLRRQPALATLCFALGRGLVQAPLAAPFVLEVLDGIGQVQAFERPAEFSQRAAQQHARRADERAARQVFAVAGLLADQHQRGTGRAFAPHRLRRLRGEGAVLARRGLALQRFEARRRRASACGLARTAAGAS